MRKLLLSLCLTLFVGITTYLSLSNSDYRLMSLDEPLKQLSEAMHTHVVPTALKGVNLAEAHAQMEFQAICSALSLGFSIWLVLFILHRIQIFFVDLSAFLPLKK